LDSLAYLPAECSEFEMRGGAGLLMAEEEKAGRAAAAEQGRSRPAGMALFAQEFPGKESPKRII